jgi:hypothetical protein
MKRYKFLGEFPDPDLAKNFGSGSTTLMAIPQKQCCGSMTFWCTSGSGSGFGSGSIPLTNESGSRSRRPKNTWIRWIQIRIRNTAQKWTIRLLVSRDVLALGILVTELLKESRDEESLQFMQFARDQMLLPDSSRRPDLNTGKRPRDGQFGLRVLKNKLV